MPSCCDGRKCQASVCGQPAFWWARSEVTFWHIKSIWTLRTFEVHLVNFAQDRFILSHDSQWTGCLNCPLNGLVALQPSIQCWLCTIPSHLKSQGATQLSVCGNNHQSVHNWTSIGKEQPATGPIIEASCPWQFRPITAHATNASLLGESQQWRQFFALDSAAGLLSEENPFMSIHSNPKTSQWIVFLGFPTHLPTLRKFDRWSPQGPRDW